MLSYPPQYTKAEEGGNSLLRVLGGILALLSILLTLLGIILHQGVAELVLGILVGIFALRVLILWLGDKPQSQSQAVAMQSAIHPMHSFPYATQYGQQPAPYAPQHMGQPAPYAPQYEQQPATYAAPYSQPQPFYQAGTQAIQPPMSMQPGAGASTFSPAPTASMPPGLPRSVRPQRPPMPEAQFPAQPIQPIQPVQPVQQPQFGQPGETRQPSMEWPAPSYASVPVLRPAPGPRPNQTGNWQYDEGRGFAPQQSDREEMSDYDTP